MSCTRVCSRSGRAGLAGLMIAALLVGGGCRGRELTGVEQSAPLTIEVPDADLDAEVHVDGNYVGQVRALSAPETGPLLLAPGIHRVEVRKPGRFPVQQTVTVKKDRNGPVVLRIELLEDPS